MGELSEIGKRLTIFLQSKKMKVNELGKLSNTSGTQIYNIVKGKKYGVDKFLCVAKQLPDINLYWLLFGEGPMQREQNDTSMLAALSDIEALEKEIESLKSVITYQDMAISAYKRSLDMAALSNEDLKKLLEFYRSQYEEQKSIQQVKTA